MRSGCRVMVLAISREPAEVQGLPSAEVQGLPSAHPPPFRRSSSPPPPPHPPPPHVNCSSCSSTKSDNLGTALAGLSLLIIRLVIYITCFHFIIGYSLSRLPRRERQHWSLPHSHPHSDSLLVGLSACQQGSLLRSVVQMLAS